MESKHALGVRANDLYETCPEAVHALLGVEHIPHHCWECACGPGAIVRILRAAGHTVWATDLVDYGCPDSMAGVDFLMERQARIDVECIVTNPPFKLAEEFVEHALALAPKVVMLLRFGFFEGQGTAADNYRRSRILDSSGLARVHLFRNRLPMMHRHGWTGKKASSRTAYAWFVWDRFHRGPPVVNRISWVRSPTITASVGPLADPAAPGLPFESSGGVILPK